MINSYPYKLRLTIDNSSFNMEKIETLLSKYADNYIYVYEVSKKNVPHFHFFFNSNRKPRTLRKYISDTFGKGNSVYSLSETEEDYPLEYIAYLFKDGTPIYNKEFPKDVIKQSSELSQTIESDKKRKKTKNTFNSIIDKYFPPDSEILKHDLWWNSSYVISSVIEYHIDNGILIREFSIVSLIQTILLKFSKHYREVEFPKKINNRLSEFKIQY